MKSTTLSRKASRYGVFSSVICFDSWLLMICSTTLSRHADFDVSYKRSI